MINLHSEGILNIILKVKYDARRTGILTNYGNQMQIALIEIKRKSTNISSVFKSLLIIIFIIPAGRLTFKLCNNSKDSRTQPSQLFHSGL